ncbi:MAG TPA: glycine betaine ABC transporter substrate-binding protein, partial [Acidimicrobiia bacterium]|nr:glycine betaine ABC transporter substrate-binding protein [Acidimicrobiia bacterium]
GGPVTVKALQDGDIDVGLLFTGSSVIDDDFVLLEDDKGLQPADNPTAVINKDKATDDVTSIIDEVNGKLTLDEYNTMALSVFNDKEDPADVAGAFLERNGLTEAGTTGEGTSLTVGSKDFAGAQLLSQAYGQALAAKGYDISYKDNIGPTETVYPLVKDGTIDLYGEYTGTLLTYLEGTPTADSQETYDALVEKLSADNLTATAPSSAQDVNGFYVTTETADKYGLTKVSDLTQPAS